MRSLAGRVKRMEAELIGPETCPCGGKWRVQVWFGEGPEPGPCPRCGTTGKIIHLIRGKEPDDLDEPKESA